MNKVSILSYICVFFLIFAFPLIPGISSAKFLLLLLVFYFILHPRLLQKYLRRYNFISKNYWKTHLVLVIVTILTTIIYFQFDFTLSSKVISSFILFPVSYILLEKCSNKIDIDRAIVYCFIIQSILILLSLISESFYNLTEPFRDVSEQNMETYGRLRGNAICGYQFFGIASMYSFVILYFILHIESFKYKIPILIILLIGAVLSGRFSIVGLIIGLFFFVLKNFKGQHLFKLFGYLIIFVSIILLVIKGIYFFAETIDDPIMSNVVNHYLIQPLDSVLVGGDFESSSTDRLDEMYKSQDIKPYLFLGSGKYTNPDGTYFGHVDAGYLRTLGYYGFFGFLILLYCFYHICFKSRNSLNLFSRWAFFILFLVLNYKGDIQVYSNNIIPIIVGFLFFSKNPQNIQSYG